MATNYLNAFKRLQEEGKECFQIIGDYILVEELENPDDEVKTTSGLYVAGSNKNTDGFEQNKPTLVRVLAVGEGYYDSEGTTVPIDAKSGDIILVGTLSVKWLSTFGPIVSIGKGSRIGITRESEIQLRFKGQHGFDEVSRILGNALEHRADSQVSGSKT